jgi:tubulin polyglutamylase TTLL6/13
MIWGGHLKPEKLQKFMPYQKTNHFPGSSFLDRKDSLCRSLSAMHRRFGADFDICPKTYLLPADKKLLEREFEEQGKNAIFIRKPTCNAEGRGIHLVTKLDQVSRE